MKILGYEAFCLGWEQILTNPLARIFSSPEEYDALNKIESGNYDLDFYVSKENLGVVFADEMEDEIESQVGGSQVLGFELPDHGAKDQLEVKSKAISSSGALDLEGCIEVPSVPSTLSGFDDILTIHFNPPIF